MTGRATTQLQVSGERFAARRIDRALRYGDVRPVHQPARSRSLAVGSLLTGIALAGCAVLAFVQPRPALGSESIVMGHRSGALYVRVGDTLHPVLNLASAQLIAATNADPRPVRESDIARAKRGPLLGIPGAPQLLGAALSGTTTWSVCDTARPAPGTTIIADDSQPVSGPQPLDPGQALLVVSGSAARAATYLLYRGRRTLVNPDHPVVAGALRSTGATLRRVSDLLLNALPESAPTDPTEFPDRVAVLDDDVSTLCVNWVRLPGGGVEIALSAGDGLPLPPGQAPVALAQADGAGPALDGFYLSPGRSAYVCPDGISGPNGSAHYLITDSGVRFTLGDTDATRSLGLPADPAPAPWPVLAGLPAGPQLSRQDALVARDVIPAAAPQAS